MLKSLACVLALTAAVPAVAETRVVRYDDLNLSSPAGLERLDRRIDAATRQVCGADETYRSSLADRGAVRKCIAEAKARAADQVARREIGATRGG